MMSGQSIRKSVGAAMLVLCAATVFAQLPNPYGAPVSGENAKKAAAAALAEARKNNWTMAAAVVDPAGDLVYFEKVDGTQAASVDIAIDKARSSARFQAADQGAAGRAGCRRRRAPHARAAGCRAGRRRRAAADGRQDRRRHRPVRRHQRSGWPMREGRRRHAEIKCAAVPPILWMRTDEEGAGQEHGLNTTV